MIREAVELNLHLEYTIEEGEMIELHFQEPCSALDDPHVLPLPKAEASLPTTITGRKEINVLGYFKFPGAPAGQSRHFVPKWVTINGVTVFGPPEPFNREDRIVEIMLPDLD